MMSHHEAAYQIQLGDRGRLVLPVEIRRRLKLRQGDKLVVTLATDGSLRLAGPRAVVGETRGLYRGLTGTRSLVDELIAERRKEARQESRR